MIGVEPWRDGPEWEKFVVAIDTGGLDRERSIIRLNEWSPPGNQHWSIKRMRLQRVQPAGTDTFILDEIWKVAPARILSRISRGRFIISELR